MQLTDSGLLCPFQHFMLPCLPVKILAHLRSSCCTFTKLVDEQTGHIWKNAAESIVPAETLPVANHSQAVQNRLRAHAAVLQDLTSGDWHGASVSRLPISDLAGGSLEWGACSTKDGLCHCLIQGGNAWHLHPLPSRATSLTDQLAALHVDAARTILANPSMLVLSCSYLQGFAIFRQQCSRTHPDWADVNAAPRVLEDQEPEQLCKLDLATGAVTEGPATIMGPQDPYEFTPQTNPTGSGLLLRRDLAAFYVVDFPSMKARAYMGSPWPTQPQHAILSGLRFNEWTSTGKIIAVWQGSQAVPTPAPIVKVYNAATGVLEQTASLPTTEDEAFAPWNCMAGDFLLEHFALSTSQQVLAVAHMDYNTEESTIVWLIDLQSGDVSQQVVTGMNFGSNAYNSIESLAFSLDSRVLAVVIANRIASSAGPAARLWLLDAPSGQVMVNMSIVGKHIFPASHDIAFILPQSRLVLFQSSCDHDDRKRCILHHVPAVPADSTDEKDIIDFDEVLIDDSSSLGSGSLSPTGSLFVTLGFVGPKACHVMLEQWQMDSQRKLCNPHFICKMRLTSASGSMSGNVAADVNSYPKRLDSLCLHVAWHPIFVDRLLYAVAVDGGVGMVHVIDGRTHSILKAVDVSLHGASGPVIQLQWSPDGTRLAVRTWEHVHLMKFGFA